MILKSLMKAGLIAATLTTPFTVSAQENVLRVMRGAASSNIAVSVNRAVVMESDRPFAEVSVANPGIADVAALSDRNLYVLGKVPGRTTLTLLGPNGDLITNVDVRVSPDIAEFKERLREVLPKERIEVRTANDGILLSGTVTGARKVERAVALANRYAPDRVTASLKKAATSLTRLTEIQRRLPRPRVRPTALIVSDLLLAALLFSS